MKKWILKAIVQKCISYLPFSTKINYVFQKYITKGIYLNDEYFYDKLQHASNHLDYYNQFSVKQKLESSLEIGTGWYPIIPICLFLKGVNTIYSIDINYLMSKYRLEISLRRIIETYQKGILPKYIGEIDKERYEKLKNTYNRINQISIDEILGRLNITYIICDARHIELPDNSIDMLHSNNTFEHIYPDVLSSILKEFKRIVNKNTGIMSHSIDMSDHFAHFDKTISIYNFLKFSDNTWKIIDNNIQPQNRLRIYDYKSMYNDLSIPISFETFKEDDIENLKQIKQSKRFRNNDIYLNAISHCHFVSKFV